MMNVTLQALADDIHGCWTGAAGTLITAVGTDTRAVTSGMLFVALRGERFDGHRYAQQALEAGAVAVVVDHDLSEQYPDVAGRQLIVADTRLALGQLAGAVRDRWTGTVIALTGNSGKTTVKEMVLTLLSEAVGEQAVLATEGNLNNDIGAPLTLLKLQPRHCYAVIELGANHIGEIAWTAALARPDVSIITNVTGAHVGEFGGMGMIAQAKGEILSATSVSGHAVLPAADRYLPFWQSLASRRIQAAPELFGLDHVEGWHVRDCVPLANGFRFTLCHQQRVVGEVTLPMLGRHNVVNALAAAAAVHAVGVEDKAIVAGLSRCRSYAQRMLCVEGRRGLRVLDDSYNANPGAMKAALETLVTQPGPHWCFMGAMGELGAASAQLHTDVGHYARALGVSLVTFGDDARAAAVAADGQHFEDWDALVAFARQSLPDHASVLVKGSHAMHMERLVEQLRA
ncbi:UDP-N-acetylmuramoyl-tripeptide--D-alanyl-D-alanine ligase [Zymobacter palmae]|uniref:UDP-N-acetylmuramoyl-tripeptide--D-alanyl-D-alanine ligase n=1 Tax=Zymobacter palmae TaxID=33074 RepID=A0A348HDH0_9GAMM|nr:UDP-N-acetylmuramoyl-tripeptide--D-alanyl-D-alanine ligase [Zymobacter palmae]BBG29672.1 UDP-N-acetylmuramoylalanyl-D-glutamyl-2 6-diaminopimelate--D-alanyl-D-alanine ligase [Zymobacter palmae]